MLWSNHVTTVHENVRCLVPASDVHVSIVTVACFLSLGVRCSFEAISIPMSRGAVGIP